MARNTMINRRAPRDGHDDFPTPPWATRSLTYYVLKRGEVQGKKAWDPACGRGYMVSALQESFKTVAASDIQDFGQFVVEDFLSDFTPIKTDWIITNPPYKSAEAFFHRAYALAREGVALLVRINWLQNAGRWDRIFKVHPPDRIAFFANRMPATQGRIVRTASVYFQHCWVVWRVGYGPSHKPTVSWIPPDAQQRLERDEDYK